MPVLDRQGDVFVLDIGDTENRFDPEWLASANALLDEVEAADGPKALVTAATGRHWSNGLDLDWLFAHGDKVEDYVAAVHTLLARVLTLPFVTAAAVQGHASAAGAVLSLAHDLRVMRADRGYWRLPEAEMDLPFTPGMARLVQARLTPQTAHEAMVTARRFGGVEALAREIVDRTAAEGEVLATAVELVRPQTKKAGPTLGKIKKRMYGPTLEALLDKDFPTG